MDSGISKEETSVAEDTAAESQQLELCNLRKQRQERRVPYRASPYMPTGGISGVPKRSFRFPAHQISIKFCPRSIWGSLSAYLCLCEHNNSKADQDS
ncbi:hypothetical protein AVEN_183233-1 [Araneus ventricosus]|uniref:Uncharacterized protein n=1 Tax=Araneus ventricosus TaxID=182803 RepID=A0A4Y2S0E9_ARAVE|nr:hypothetical protein AVEN_183233-1 [Araneus ventricosus]